MTDKVRTFLSLCDKVTCINTKISNYRKENPSSSLVSSPWFIEKELLDFNLDMLWIMLSAEERRIVESEGC